MRPDLSIIIPSLGKTEFLKPLLDSLLKQKFSGQVEILLCVTGAPDLAKSLPPLKPGMNLQVCASQVPGISLARNIGIEAARGELVLFLDEDCFLPSPDFLDRIAAFSKAHPECGGGGGYLTVDGEASFASAFYNYMCNAWLESHVTADGTTPVLLGGCCFYPRAILQDVRFPPHKPRAGEEFDFNLRLVERGHRLYFNRAWSVVHKPDYQLEDIFRRAWNHGMQLENATVVPKAQRLQQFMALSQRQPTTFLKYLPLTLAYGAWGRAAYASKFVRRRG